MQAQRKITVQLSDQLIKKAQKASGLGLTPTIRRGLELVAAGKTYDRLRALKGKVRFSIDLKALREDRL